MRPESGDEAYLWDMREAQAARKYVESRTLAEFLADRFFRSAVQRELEIIGEAARQVSGEFRLSHPDIPRTSIIAQRNVIAHGYAEINDELIWDVTQARLALLIEQINQTLPSDELG